MRPTSLPRLLRAAPLLLALSLPAPRPAAAQVLPPIYKPLAEEAGARHVAAADSLRRRAQELAGRAAVLEEGARTLRQNGTGVAEKLGAEARQARDEAAQLETRAAADTLTAAQLRGQADRFAARAESHRLRAAQARDSVALLRRPPPAPITPPAPVMAEPTPDSVALAGAPLLPTAPVAAPVPDTLTAARVQALLDGVRADSQTAVALDAQAAELRGRARRLQTGAGSAQQRAAELRRQHEQLQGYATEILTGRGAAEPTVAHLEREAAQLRAQSERHQAEAREQDEQVRAFRVQADRSWLPVRSRAEAARFYGEDGRSVLRSMVLSLGDGIIPKSVNGEVVSDYVGPVRLGAGVVLAKSGDSRDSTSVEAAALKRFYAGGGNVVLHATLPLFFDRSHYHSFTLQTLQKAALDIPGTGRATAAEAVPVNLDLGLEAYATFNTFASRIKAFALLRSGHAMGNDAFRRNLATDHPAVSYLQLTFGTEIASLAKILLSGARAADGLGQELSLTVQVGR